MALPDNTTQTGTTYKANIDSTAADHETRISSNETDVSDHETRISSNETDLADHETRISSNETKTGYFTNVDGTVTASDEEINALAGLMASTAELNTMDGIIASTDELNTMAGITATTTEVNYTDGVTSNIQTQIDNISETTMFGAADGGPYVDSGEFDVAANITNTWESVGPTGSGADYIWTALDSVPSGASWIRVKVYMNIAEGTISSAAITAALLARNSGGTVGNLTRAKIADVFASKNGDGDAQEHSLIEVSIPVTSGVFELYYSSNPDTAFSGETVDMWLVGYESP